MSGRRSPLGPGRPEPPEPPEPPGPPRPPDGSLVTPKRAPGSVYYLLRGADKRRIPDQETFVALKLDPRRALALDTAILDSYLDRYPIPSRRDGTVIDASWLGQSFVMQSGKRRLIPNAETRGFLLSAGAIAYAALSGDLDAIVVHERGAIPSRKNGSLLREAGGQLHLMRGGFRRRVPDRATLLNEEGVGTASDVLESDLLTIPDGGLLSSILTDGLIIRTTLIQIVHPLRPPAEPDGGDGEEIEKPQPPHYMHQGRRRLIPASTLALLFGSAPIRDITPAAWNEIPRGRPLPELADNVILTVAGKEVSYHFIGGVRRLIPDNDRSVVSGVTRVIEVLASDLPIIPEGAPLPEPTDLLGSLATKWPLLLLPVRIETRFGIGNAGERLLRVRIYPDEVHVDAHEPVLTANERDARARFQALAGAERETRLREWGALVSRFGRRRAAYIAQAAEPIGPPRETMWTHAPRANALPDQWIVLGYKGTGADRLPMRVFEVAGKRINGDVSVAPSPSATTSIEHEGLQLDSGMRWMVDYNNALERGMAVTVKLPTEAHDGVDLLLVLGVRHGEGTPGWTRESWAAESARVAQSLFDAHHYTDGAAFVPYGTATNNTSEGSSGLSSRETTEASFAIECETSLCADAGSAGALVARALGIDSGVFAHLGNADEPLESRDSEGRAMRTSLWPATLGYALEQLRGEALLDSDAVVDGIHRYFADEVRTRGRYPALRFGRQPYGLVAVTSLRRWLARGDHDAGDERLLDILGRLRGVWLESLPSVKRVGQGEGGDALISILATQAVSGTLAGRSVLGPEYTSYLWSFLGKLDQPGDRIGKPWWDRQRAAVEARLSQLGLTWRAHRAGRRVYANEEFPIPEPLVSARASAEIAWLRDSAFEAIHARKMSQFGKTSVLYLVLRHAALRAYASAMYRLRRTGGIGAANEHFEPEMIDIASRGTHTALTDLGDLFEGTKMSAYLDARRASLDHAEWTRFWEGLALLVTLAPERLRGLFHETLDLCSNRLDAWLSGFAARRLDWLRKTQPHGIYLGAYGWVEDLKPSSRTSASLGGYVHAPSLTQAATAAILRSGFMSHGGGDGPFAIDLSADRVRRARWLLDGVRAGRSLGGLLGYQLERSLQGTSAATFIPKLRSIAPLPGGGLDGLALLEDRAKVPAELHPEIDALAESVDAVADLLIAEGVHQMASGNRARAASVLEAVGQGRGIVDEPTVAVTPIGGDAVNHRVLVVLGDAKLAPAQGWTTSPRARAEPRIEAWLRRSLGKAAELRGRVELRWDDTVRVEEVPFSALRLGASDVVWMDEPQLSARLIDAARLAAEAPPGATAKVLEERATSWKAEVLGLADVRAWCRAARELVSAGRPVQARDLALPDAEPTDGFDEAVVAELAGRVPLAELHSVRDRLAGEGETLRAALLDAADLGVGDTFPRAPSEWRSQADSAARELERRLKAIGELAMGVELAQRCEREVERLRITFASGIKVVPPLRPTASFLAAVAASSTVQAGNPLRAVAWLQRLARVRAGAGRLDRMLAITETLRGDMDPTLDLRVAQLPPGSGQWIALPGGPANPRGMVSIVATVPSPIERADLVAGLFVDEWTETIPRKDVTTGVAFQFDDPSARAPQAMLLAVPPDDVGRWRLRTLETILLETVELAKIRAVDPDALRHVGHYLPASYFAINLADEAVSTDFSLVGKAP